MTHDLDTALAGISGILVTPYDADGEVAPTRLAPIIDRALAAGVHMPVVNGNTGEFYALTTDEACTMVAEVAALVDGRAPLLAGIGRSVRDACRLAKASQPYGFPRRQFSSDTSGRGQVQSWPNGRQLVSNSR